MVKIALKYGSNYKMELIMVGFIGKIAESVARVVALQAQVLDGMPVESHSVTALSGIGGSVGGE